jgi:hypothetical protein
MELDLGEISKQLGLKDMSHWGIINSDGNRVVEFIKFIKEKGHIDFRIQYCFVELIIASMNDAINEGKADFVVQIRFYEYIKPILNDNRYYPYVLYWISIKSKEKYPVGFLLEKYIMEDQRPKK